MGTLDYIVDKYALNLNQRMPVEIPNVGRDDLARLFAELGFKQGVELGVEQGKYSEVLLKNNPGLHLFCVDAWRAYRGYREHVNQEKLDGFVEATKERLKNFNVTFVREFSMDGVALFEDNSLDFVYIDANHEYRQVVDDISEWIKKIRPGGIISGHDYCKRKNPGYLCHVIEAVQGYTSAYHISPWFVLGSKEIRGTRDRPRSWMWVKA